MENKTLDILAILRDNATPEKDGFTIAEIFDLIDHSGVMMGRNKVQRRLAQAVADGKLEAAWLTRVNAWGVKGKRQGYRIAANGKA